MASVEPEQHQHRYHYLGQGQGVELPKCRRPKWMGCDCGHRQLVRCQSSNERACEPCAATYRRRVRRVCSSGFRHATEGSLVFMTFTAPGASAHWLRSGRRCRCTPPGGVDLAEWNGQAVHRWNRLQQHIERAYGLEFAYFKAVEVQTRGALHLHVCARFARSVTLKVANLRRLAIRHGFGHAVDVQVIGGEGVAGYLAKYVTKASTERQRVPYCHRATGEIGPGRWRTWSASRDWGATMGSIRAAQAMWARLAAASAAAAPGAGVAGPLDPNTPHYACAGRDPP